MLNHFMEIAIFFALPYCWSKSIGKKETGRYHGNDESSFDAIELINRKLYKNNKLFQGDILSPLHENGGSRNRRNIVKTKRWDTTRIPFYITNSMSTKGKTAIRNAVNKLSEISCIQMIEHNEWSIEEEPNHIIFNFGLGCYSQYVGQYGGKQEISIGRGCEYIDVVIHEILHALGFWHVQSRIDRDQYVTIHFENIATGREVNFGIWQGTTPLDHEYDLKSIMHYGPLAFSKNGEETITPKDPSKTLSKNNELSVTDISQINTLYCNGLTTTASTSASTIPTATITTTTSVQTAKKITTFPTTTTTIPATTKTTGPTTTKTTLPTTATATTTKTASTKMSYTVPTITTTTTKTDPGCVDVWQSCMFYKNACNIISNVCCKTCS